MRINVLSCGVENAKSYLEIDGQRWSLEEQELDAGQNTPKFICVSYTWGDGRVLSPLHGNFSISDRTIPALKAVVHQRQQCRAIWLDALCVPPPEQEMERAATLESMGFIYAQAAEVVVVLSCRARATLEQIQGGKKLVSHHLDDLECEEWVSRAWTYQEAVNAKTICLTCEDSPPGLSIDLYKLFSSVGEALSGLSAEAMEQYPRLNALEFLMLDYAMAPYLERSALQVMSIMDNRTQTCPEDHFYAMIGAISPDPATPSKVLGPCESFIALCERKGDYSFIYSPTERDTTPGRRWRPVMSADLPAILRLHSWGDGQLGHFEDGSFYLDAMMVLQPGEMEFDAVEFVMHWLASVKQVGKPEVSRIGTALLPTLRKHGFSGSGAFVSTARGLFFLSTPLPPCGLEAILVATGVNWTLGAPGLGIYGLAEDKCYVTGVLVGKVRNVVGPLVASVRM